MNDRPASIESEIRSIERRADQSCSIHSVLRDRYERRAKGLDYLLMLVATYLMGLSFVEPTIGLPLSFGLNTQVLIACLSLATFFLSIVQFKNDWKNKAHDHQISFAEYAAVKSECRAVTSGTRTASAAELQRIRTRYEVVADVGTHIPDNAFVNGKARHVRKVYMSRHLDSHPGASVLLLRFKLFFRDNLGINWLNHDSSAQKNDGSQALPKS